MCSLPWTHGLSPADVEHLLQVLTRAQREFGGALRTFDDWYLLDELCELRRDLRAARSGVT